VLPQPCELRIKLPLIELSYIGREIVERVQEQILGMEGFRKAISVNPRNGRAYQLAWTFGAPPSKKFVVESSGCRGCGETTWPSGVMVDREQS
jgi:hypothetical protein